MFLKSRLIQIVFLPIIFAIYFELSFGQAPSPPNITRQEQSVRSLDSLKSKVDSLRSELHRIDDLEDEYSELKIKIANKYIDATNLLTTVVEVFVGVLALILGGSGIGSWLTLRKARRASLEIRRIKEESERKKKDFEKFVESAKKDIEVQKGYALKIVEKLQNEVRHSKKLFESEIKKCNSSIQSLSKRFRESVDLNTEIMFELMKEYTDLLPITIDKEKLGKIFDRVYKRKTFIYYLQSFILDLITADKEDRIRAIWGIEGMGKADNIKDLQKIADNKDEDPDIRVEAQRAVDNMKRRLKIQ